MKKDVKWDWTGKCGAAFLTVKDAIASEPILKLPDFELLLEVHTDASDKAFGCVLVQEGHLVAFESRKLNHAVLCLQTWRVYLLGTCFVEWTDNMTNIFFKIQKQKSPKQAKLVGILGRM